MQALASATRFAVNLGQAQGRQMSVPQGPAEVVMLSEAFNEASKQLHLQMLDIQAKVDQVHEHEAQLEEQNEQLEAIFTLSPDGLVTFDPQVHVRFANHAFMLLTGLEDTQVLGSTSWTPSNLSFSRWRRMGCAPPWPASTASPSS